MGYCPNEIFIDDANNIIITDINRGRVLVFNHKNMLFKKIGSFHESREVTMGYKYGYLTTREEHTCCGRWIILSTSELLVS